MRNIAMPRFFFHLRTDCGRERDWSGLYYPDLDQAYLEACRSIPELAAEFITAGRDPMEFRFEIANAEGVVVMEVPFRELLRPAAPAPRPQAPRRLSLHLPRRTRSSSPR